MQKVRVLSVVPLHKWLNINDIQGFVPLPKTVSKARIEENASVFDFELDGDDMAKLNTGAYAPCTWDPTVSRD